MPADVDAVVVRALDPEPAARYPEAGAFADALDRCLTAGPRVDPTSTTTRYDARPPAGAQHRAMSPAHPGLAAPLLGLLAALVLVLGSLGAILVLGSEPDQRTALAAPSPSPTAPPATDPSDPPAATSDPTPEQSVDLCEPDPGSTCALAPGVYEPSRFEPSVSFHLDGGWEAFRAGDRLVVLARDEGYLTLASGNVTAFDGDEEYEVRANANAIANAFASDPAIAVLDRSRDRVDGHRAIRLDLAPSGDRAPLFGSGDDVFYAETDTVTRVYVFEVRGEPVILALEGANGVDLDAFLDAAGGALSSLSLG